MMDVNTFFISMAEAVQIEVSSNSREKILAAATRVAQARGYGGLNFRDLAEQVGIKSASMYYHFASKADLGTAIARRYWENSAVTLNAMLDDTSDPLRCLHDYPDIFRKLIESDNRLCLGSFMATEYDDLPEAVKKEVHAFADVHVAWLARVLCAAAVVSTEKSERRAHAIYAAIVGAQIIARSRSNVALYDELIQSYRLAGLLPA